MAVEVSCCGARSGLRDVIALEIVLDVRHPVAAKHVTSTAVHARPLERCRLGERGESPEGALERRSLGIEAPEDETAPALDAKRRQAERTRLEVQCITEAGRALEPSLLVVDPAVLPTAELRDTTGAGFTAFPYPHDRSGAMPTHVVGSVKPALVAQQDLLATEDGVPVDGLSHGVVIGARRQGLGTSQVVGSVCVHEPVAWLL
jgi:hypothetical protein